MPRPTSRRTSTRTAAAFAAVLIVLASGCASDGRDLGEAEVPDLSGITPPTSADLPLVQDGPDGMTISSPAFAPGAAIPGRFTINDLNISPPLRFGEASTTAAELAVVVRDPDSGFVHWLVTGIAPAVVSWPEDIVSPESVEHLNGDGYTGWAGPDTSEGAKGRLQFEFYTLSAPSGFTDATDPTEILEALQSNALNRAAFIARYGSA